MRGEATPRSWPLACVAPETFTAMSFPLPAAGSPAGTRRNRSDVPPTTAADGGAFAALTR